MSAIEQRRMTPDEMRRVVLDAQARQQQVTITNNAGEKLTGSAFLDRASHGFQLYGRHRDAAFETCIHGSFEDVLAAEAADLRMVVPYYKQLDDQGHLNRASDLLSPSVQLPPGTNVVISPVMPAPRANR